MAVRGHSVEFPVLGKFYSRIFRRPCGRMLPVDSCSVTSGLTICDRIVLEAAESTAPNPQSGAVVAGGVTFKIWILKLSPEIRYTRWVATISRPLTPTNSRD